MKRVREFLWTEETYEIKDSGSFLPNITGYLHEDGQPHPAMLVVPGGGYYVVSPTESRLVADQFHAAGYHAFILTYTTNCGDMRDFLNLPLHPLGTQPLLDISRALCCIRAHAGIWNVDPAHIAVCGFSAGAHLTGSLAVHSGEDFLIKDARRYIRQFFPGMAVNRLTAPNSDGYEKPPASLNRPDAVLLCYPVITTDSRFRHEGSIRALTGSEPDDAVLLYHSLEKQVTPDMPPVFLWHTITDDAVPVENSLLFMNACRNADVPCELHLFPEGPHGLSTADKRWESRRFGEDSELCMEQFHTMLLSYAERCPGQLPNCAAPLLAHPELDYFASHWDEILAKYRGFSYPSTAKKDDAVSVWPALAASFLKRYGF